MTENSHTLKLKNDTEKEVQGGLLEVNACACNKNHIDKEVIFLVEKGWIKLHRQLQECPMWYSERFSKGQAWVDLLLLANHSDKKILFNSQIITIGRGQYLTSIVKLAEKWQWSRPTVTKFLKLLEKEEMITRSSDNTKTLITIENYGIYQDFNDEGLQPTLQPTLQASCNSFYTNNNDNNDKNEKNIILSNFETKDCHTQEAKQALEKWNELGVYGIKTVGKLKTGTQRHQMLQARITEYGIDDVLKAIDKVRLSSFLQGKHKGRPWQITFDWFVRPNNFPKVLDGNYDDKTGGDDIGNSRRNDSTLEEDAYGATFYDSTMQE